MRIMIARTKRIETYRDASTAIRASRTTDSSLRTVSDEQVHGKQIRQMLWSDEALTLELESEKYLNIVAKNDGIECSLDDSPAVTADSAMDEEFHFELDGRTLSWPRAELRRHYVGHSLERLWFGSGIIYIYTQQGILACHLIESCPEGTSWLFWIDSE